MLTIVCYGLAFLLFAWGFWPIMLGGWTTRQDSWGNAHRHRLVIDSRPRFLEYDSHLYLNSLGTGGLWTLALGFLIFANPGLVATVIISVFGPAKHSWLVAEAKTAFAAVFILNTVLAYIIRISIGRQFKSTGIDLPPEAIATWQDMKNKGRLVDPEKMDDDPIDDGEPEM
ncbi:MAG: hypothetical protein KC777_13075 [Cyanobacteria bacterium HKST-UBA02]|nr:hypothetical protein [Cyanobacteria bacterium HKST-UBA02]